MTRAYGAATPEATILGGAVGGCLGGLAALVVLTAGSVLDEHRLPAGLNAVGAWSVRWLQTAGADAIDHFYWDATLGGAVYGLLVATLGGALFAVILARLPEDHPLAWGIIVGVALWAGLRLAVGPALDPVLVRTFDWHVLLPTCVVYGLVIGHWVNLSRRVATALWMRV